MSSTVNIKLRVEPAKLISNFFLTIWPDKSLNEVESRKAPNKNKANVVVYSLFLPWRVKVFNRNGLTGFLFGIFEYE